MSAQGQMDDATLLARARQEVDRLLPWAFEEDAPDITSAAICGDHRMEARIRAKEEGVLCGAPFLEPIFKFGDRQVQLTLLRHDGDRLEPGDEVAQLSGPARDLFSAERIALNLIQRLSGIASKTARYVARLEGTRARLLDTRKTLPAWRHLEKYAVRQGGGTNHRMGAWDAYMIKDTHIDAAGSIAEAVDLALDHRGASQRAIIIEVRDRAELDAALETPVDRIMLDNFSQQALADAVIHVAGRKPLEATGGITEENLARVAATGVDFISVGAITHSVPALDLSMTVHLEAARPQGG